MLTQHSGADDLAGIGPFDTSDIYPESGPAGHIPQQSSYPIAAPPSVSSSGSNLSPQSARRIPSISTERIVSMSPPKGFGASLMTVTENEGQRFGFSDVQMPSGSRRGSYMGPIGPEATGSVTQQKKTLVLCFDGTGNKFKGNSGDTNILKIFSMLDRRKGNQYHYYQRK